MWRTEGQCPVWGCTKASRGEIRWIWECLGTVGGCELARVQLEQHADLVAHRVVTVEGTGNWERHQRSEEMIDPFDAEEHRELRGNIQCGGAQRHHGRYTVDPGVSGQATLDAEGLGGGD